MDRILLGNVFVPASPLKDSYVHSTSPRPLLPWTMGQLLEQAYEDCPDKEAFIFGHSNERLTYRELRDTSREYAKGLLARGLSKYDVIYVSGVVSSDWLLIFFAAQTIGAVVLTGPVHKPYDNDALRVIQKSGCKMVVVGPLADNEIFHALCKAVMDGDKLNNRTSVEHIYCQSGTFANHPDVKKRNVASLATLAYLGRCVLEDDFLKAFDSVIPEDPAYICRSSGSTGEPKLVACTHRHTVNAGQFGIVYLNNDKYLGHKIAFLGPWCDILLSQHCVASVLVNRTNTRGIVLQSGIDNIGSPALKLLERERCTHCYMWPAYYLDMVGTPGFDNYDLSSLCGGFIGGQKFSKEKFESMMETFPDLTYGYGSSETSHISSTLAVDGNYERRLTTVGYPTPYYEVKVVDPKDRIVPVNTRGELWVRSCWGMFWGYWNEPETTAKALTPGGWYRTGDIGTMSPYGFLTLIGRTTDAIRFKRFADIVYPGPIEDVVRSFHKVLEAKVVSTHDDHVGDRLHLFVTRGMGCDLTQEELEEFCEIQFSEENRPEFMHILDVMPRTGGRHKISGLRLREMAEEFLLKNTDNSENNNNKNKQLTVPHIAPKRTH